MHLIDESISMRDVNYRLIGLVRNTGRHFSCAVLTSFVLKSWDYIDDLNNNILHFDSLHNLFMQQREEWFFCVYIRQDGNILNDSEESRLIHFDVSNSVQNRKRKTSESNRKDYPLRSKKSKSNKIYYEKNKEKLKAQSCKYHERNKEKHNAQSNKYYQKNKEKLRAINNEYYQNNEEKLKIMNIIKKIRRILKLKVKNIIRKIRGKKRLKKESRKKILFPIM